MSKKLYLIIPNDMWKSILKHKPPTNLAIMTKIDDGNNSRNECLLKFDGRLWWTPDGGMYVYYTPTHWKY